MPQWLGAFLRYAVVAVTTKQLTWADAMAHGLATAPNANLELVGRQLQAAEAAQRQAEKVSKQLLETQQALLKRAQVSESRNA